MSSENLKNIETHFAFGKNWASYAGLIDEPQIEEAKKGLLKLIPADEFKGRSFLDIGCGSGLHALAAAQLGVSRIMAVDIDPDSVATSTAVLSSNNVTTPWRAEIMSVFDLDAARQGAFDIVYSGFRLDPPPMKFSNCRRQALILRLARSRRVQSSLHGLPLKAAACWRRKEDRP